MDEPPADNVAPSPWRERGDLLASDHGPVLLAFDRTMRQINTLSVMILGTGLANEDRDRAMDLIAAAATQMLRANLLYVEKCVLPEMDAAADGVVPPPAAALDSETPSVP
jgi:hypothetical protein